MTCGLNRLLSVLGLLLTVSDPPGSDSAQKGTEDANRSVSITDFLPDARAELAEAHAGVDWSRPGHRDSGWGYESQRRLVWGLGEVSQIELARVPDAAMLVLNGRPFVHHGSRVQTVDLAINGEVFRRLRLAPWRRTYRVRIPERLLTETRFLLSLRYRWAARPDEVLADSTDSRRLAVSWSSLELRRVGESTRTTIRADGDRVILTGSGRVRIPLRAGLPLALAADEVAARHTRGLRIRLDVEGSEPVEQLWRSGGTQRLAVEAGSTDPSHLRLTLQAARRTWLDRLLALRRAPVVELAAARIEASGEVTWPSRDLARMGFSALPGDSTAEPRLVVLWVVDTLRMDHLGLYGYQRDTSPRLDAFAEDAVVFERAVAQSAWTRPSVTSILTGQLLKRHGVYGKGDALAREATTLAELMHRAGYDTAAFITNGNLRHVGLEQGFAAFRHFKEGRVREFHHPAERVLTKALDRLDRNPGSPAFFYLHTTDPHLPYMPTPTFADNWPVADPSVGTIDGYRATINSPEPATQDLIDLYDAEIRQADAAFGALVDGLRERQLYDDALIIFTADHGEEFLDHGAWQHGNSLFAEQIATPLVIRWPTGASPWPAGSRVGTVAAHADIAPTILAAVGVASPATMQGRDLARDESRPTLAELRGTFRASVDRRYKLITDLDGNPLGLYDARSDPEDRVDLTFSHPEVLEYHRRLQALFIERSAGGPGAESAEQDAETLEQLRALGYVN